MANAMDLLGSLIQKGLKGSNSGRIEHSLGDQGIGGKGGFLDEILGGLTGQQPAASQQQTSGLSGALGSVSDLAGSILGDPKSLKAGGLGALAGAILGGGGKSMAGAMGGGALALLGSLALKAMRSASEKSAEKPTLDPATSLDAGLRAPQNEAEKQQLQSIASLTVRAMINAAKADGRIDEAEMERIVGNVKENELGREEVEFLVAELRKPMDTDDLVRLVPNTQVACQVYAASLLAVTLDTEAEKRYLRELATKLRIDPHVVAHLHRAVGVPA